MIKLNNKDIIWSYAGTILSIFSNVIMLPFILHYLNADEYGLWAVFQSVGGITILFDFGFAVSFSRNIAYCYSGAKELKKEGVKTTTSNEPDYLYLKKILKTCGWIYFIISLIALLLISTVGSIYIIRISTSLDGSQHYIAWACYAMAIFLNLYYGYYSAALRGVGDIAELNQATVLARLVQIALTILLLFLGFRLLGIGIAYLIYTFVFRLFARRFFWQFNKIGEKISSVTEIVSKEDIWNIFKIVWYNASKDGLVTLANYISNQASTIICSLYMSLSETGMYALAMQLATAIVNVAATMYNSYQPVLQSAYVIGDKKTMQKCMSVVTVTFIISYIIGITIVITIGLPVINILRQNATTISILLGVAIYQFMLKYRNCYTSYFSCTNRLPYVKAFILSSIGCVLLELLFMGCWMLGVKGLIVAQVLSQLVFNFWYWPLKAHQELGLKSVDMVNICMRELKGKMECTKR